MLRLAAVALRHPSSDGSAKPGLTPTVPGTVSPACVQCTSSGWLIEPLDDGQGPALPADIYAQQRLARLAAGAPPASN
jgi:hypothetical protein